MGKSEKIIKDQIIYQLPERSFLDAATQQCRAIDAKIKELEAQKKELVEMCVKIAKREGLTRLSGEGGAFQDSGGNRFTLKKELVLARAIFCSKCKTKNYFSSSDVAACTEKKPYESWGFSYAKTDKGQRLCPVCSSILFKTSTGLSCRNGHSITER